MSKVQENVLEIVLEIMDKLPRFNRCKLRNWMKKKSERALIRYLDDQSKIIESLAPKVFRRLTGRPVHQLRIATRRVRAALWVLSKSSDRLEFPHLNRDLQRVGKVLGRVRELDVAVSDATKYEISSSDLCERRKIAQKELRRVLSSRERKRLERRLRAACATAQNADQVSFKKPCRLLRARLGKVLATPVRPKSNLHPIRVLIKKSQYALEAMGDSSGPMKNLQGILGDANDLAFLQANTGKNAKLRAQQIRLNAKAVQLFHRNIQHALTQLRGKRLM